MDLDLEWPLKVEENLFLGGDQKVEKPYQPKIMVKLESLKKSSHFKKTLKDKKVHSEYFSIFAIKNFIQKKNKNNLIISFVMKKKIGNAVKRNKIRRKLKAIVIKLLKIKGAINKDYTYIVFGKPKAYEEKQNILHLAMEKCFKKIK